MQQGEGSDGGPSAIASGDVLVVESRNGGSDVTLIRNTKVCFFPELVHADGTREAIQPSAGMVTVSVANPSVATSALSLDCAMGGVVGVSAGASTLTVKFTSGGLSIQGTAVVTVGPEGLVFGRQQDVPMGYVLPLAASATATAQMLPHEAQPGYGYYENLLLTYGVAPPANLPRDAELVGSWLHLTTADSATVAVSHVAGDDGDAWSLQTGAAGSTTLTAHYDAPNQPLSVDVPVALFAWDPSSLGSGDLGIELTDAVTGAPLTFDQELPPGSCFVPRLWANVYGTTTQDQAHVDLMAGVTWSTSTAGMSTVMKGTHPEELCVGGKGLLALHGCAGSGACADASIFVGASGSETLSLALLDPSPVPGAITPFGYQVCPSLRAKLGSGAGAIDVTSISSFDLRSTTDNNLQFSPDVHTGGQGFDGSGDPCFLLYSTPGTPMTQLPKLAGPGTSLVQAKATYAGSSATPISVTLQGTWVAQ